MTSPLRDAESATAGVPVVREELRWQKKITDYEAATEYGHYVISMDAPTAGGAANLWMAGADVDTFEVFPTLLAAQIAAEVDYGRRPILSELDTARAEIERLQQWRELALQFDAHRIEALSVLRDVAAGMVSVDGVKLFLSTPPTQGNELTPILDAAQSALTAAQARIAELEGFADKAAGTCLGVAMSGKSHPDPDGALMGVFNAYQAIRATLSPVKENDRG